MTGTIVSLAGNTRTGTIRSRGGSRLTFSAAVVLGEFDTLAVGHLVSFDLDRAQPHHTAVRVFREPVAPQRPDRGPGVSPDLRYTGFHQAEAIRTCCFDAVAGGHPTQHFTVTVDMALLLKRHIGFQEVPALCLRKLAADLGAIPGSAHHELNHDDLLAFAVSRAAAVEKKRAKRSFPGRRACLSSDRSHPTRPPPFTAACRRRAGSRGRNTGSISRLFAWPTRP